MNDNLLLVLLKATISTLLFYLIYWLFFKRETFFTFNRIYLLISAILSMILPILPITLPTILSKNPFQSLSLESMIPDQTGHIGFQIANSNTLVSNDPLNSGFQNIILGIYFAGVFLFTLLYITRLIRISCLINSSQAEKHSDLHILKTEKYNSPFSFFRVVFINSSLYSKNDFDQIITHERIHFRQGHSFDLLIIELIKNVLWFNPVIWLITKSLRQTHEYLADRGVLREGHDKKFYQLLILQQSVDPLFFSLANTFVLKETKGRIDMLNARPSSLLSKFKMLLILPVLFFLLTLFHVPSQAIEASFFNDEIVQFGLPLNEGRISLKFGMAKNPFTNQITLHKGIDIAAPTGTVIYAASNGTVIIADSVEGRGNRIVIQHNKGFTTHYFHLSAIHVSKNQRVKIGESIGLVGNTGLSTAPHLHFEVRQNGEAVDPMDYLDFSSYGKK